MECVGPGIPFRVGEEYCCLQASGQLTDAGHPWIGLRLDPVGADRVDEGVAADG